jgi:hypothetical protein
MNVMDSEHVRYAREDQGSWPEEQVIEVSLLLPERQAAELERLASFRGLTLGELIRLLLNDSLGGWRVHGSRTVREG